MNELSKLLDLKVGDVFSIIGSGGKTSIMWLIATENLDKSVMITTTTKIKKPKVYRQLAMDEKSIKSIIPKNGINVIGSNLIDKLGYSGKDIIEKSHKVFDLCLIEADGSKNCPLKGWNNEEPVVLDITTHTIGVLSIKGIGKKLDENSVHRPERFSQLTGLSCGGTIKEEHVVKILLNCNNGIFKNAMGKITVIINGVENYQEFESAKRLKEMLNVSKYNFISNIIVGSAKETWWRRL